MFNPTVLEVHEIRLVFIRWPEHAAGLLYTYMTNKKDNLEVYMTFELVYQWRHILSGSYYARKEIMAAFMNMYSFIVNGHCMT